MRLTKIEAPIQRSFASRVKLFRFPSFFSRYFSTHNYKYWCNDKIREKEATPQREIGNDRDKFVCLFGIAIESFHVDLKSQHIFPVIRYAAIWCKNCPFLLFPIEIVTNHTKNAYQWKRHRFSAFSAIPCALESACSFNHSGTVGFTKCKYIR